MPMGLPSSGPAHQRDGNFELVIGRDVDVAQYLFKKKQAQNETGQLSLSANVVETSLNLEYLPPQTHVWNTLLPYINLNQRSRNGAPGQEAAFVYPLRQPTGAPALPGSSGPVHLGVYVDGQDLQNFLNTVGHSRWNEAVKESPDKVTQFALEYAEQTGMDAQGKPIALKDVSFPAIKSTPRNGSGLFLDILG
jgi:hypothetical protein